jgi:two-component system nitrogen regulation response regulator NtrX
VAEEEAIGAESCLVSVNLPLDEARKLFERAYLTIQHKRANGNISAMARFVGMERSALQRKLKALGV